MKRLGQYVTGRVLAWLVIALLGAALGIGRAEAQARPGAPIYADREKALAACQADKAAYLSYFEARGYQKYGANTGKECDVWTPKSAGATNPWQGYYSCDIQVRNPSIGTSRYRCDQYGNVGANAGSSSYYASIECPADKPWDPVTGKCGQSKCPAGESQGPRPGTSDRLDLVGSLRCVNECEVVYQRPASWYVEGIMTGTECKPDDYKCPAGTTEVLVPGVGQTCEPIRPCPAGQQKDPETGQCMKPAECPAGQVKDADGNCKDKEDACPAGQTKAPDGSCVRNECPEGQARGSDGTCKPDEDDDGKPDDGEDSGQFGDSTDCNTPPKCSGDNILCGQVIIQWRIECNTRKKANVAGGACGAGAAPPICDGEGCNSQMQAQLIQQWRAACALEALKSPNEGAPVGDANKNGVPDILEGEFNDGQLPAVEGVFSSSEENLWSKVRTGGFLGGGSCPGLPQLSIGGRTLDLGEAPCQIGAYFGMFLNAFGVLLAAAIIGKAAAGVS